MVGTAIRSLNTKTESIGQAVTAVGSIIENQERLAESMKSQGNDLMDRVERIQKDYLDSLDDQREDFLEDMKANQQVFAKIVEKLEELRAVVRDENAVERMTQEVTGALTTINRAGIKSNEAFADNLRSTLMPLVEAVAASNEAHKSLVASVESSHRSIEMTNSQLMDELMGKIDLISTPQERSLSASEEASKSSLETIVDATQAPGNVAAADVRTA
jgi:hypothetical protein